MMAIPKSISLDKSYKMPFGKYKDWTLGDIQKVNPKYIKWIKKKNVLKNPIKL
tara:strand:+ start:3262 stop:3420 length:159 start_codon:yes stop_codon:yes gene_type:complete